MLSVSNKGNSAARNLRLKIDRAFYVNAEQNPQSNLQNFQAFKEEIASFAPRAELKFFLGIGHTVMGDSVACPRQFSVTAEYTFDRERVEEETVVDLSPYLRYDVSKDPISNQLEKINSTLTKIANK